VEVSGQLHAPAALPPRERAHGARWIRGWVSPIVVLYMVSKTKIPSSRLESNPEHPIVQPVASHYTGWAIATLVFFSEALERNARTEEHTAAERDIMSSHVPSGGSWTPSLPMPEVLRHSLLAPNNEINLVLTLLAQQHLFCSIKRNTVYNQTLCLFVRTIIICLIK
jgi:hypothetical protein